jgi:type II secretion system protein G
MTPKKGFTLIELLVVVAIIGLLATLSIVALNTARAKARDAKRVGDIKQIQTALELYYNDNGGYPSTDIIAAKTIATNSIVYMNQVPTAPVPYDNPSGSTVCTATNNAYVYSANTNNTSYTLTYCLGGDTGGLLKGLATATPAGIK